MTLYSVRVHNLSGKINPEGPKLRFILVKLQDCCEKEEEEKKKSFGYPCRPTNSLIRKIKVSSYFYTGASFQITMG